MMRFPKTVQGSVISGTMRPEDLIPAFLNELGGIDSLNLSEIELRMKRKGYYETEASQWDLETLFDLLNEAAPIGLYFGAHPGDGSDYGFWANEDDDEGDIDHDDDETDR